MLCCRSTAESVGESRNAYPPEPLGFRGIRSSPSPFGQGIIRAASPCLVLVSTGGMVAPGGPSLVGSPLSWRVPGPQGDRPESRGIISHPGCCFSCAALVVVLNPMVLHDGQRVKHYSQKVYGRLRRPWGSPDVTAGSLAFGCLPGLWPRPGYVPYLPRSLLPVRSPYRSGSTTFISRLDALASR